MAFVSLAGQFHSNSWITFALRLNLDLVKRVKTFSALHIYLGHQTLTLVAFSSAPDFFFSTFQFFKVGVVILFSQALVLIVTVSKKLDRHPGWLVFGAVPFKCITLDLLFSLQEIPVGVFPIDPEPNFILATMLVVVVREGRSVWL